MPYFGPPAKAAADATKGKDAKSKRRPAAP
jgi:hypothetical protein